MIIVTGGAGFIGSNLVKKLNHEGYSNILVVDNFADGSKFVNLAACTLLDYEDKEDFIGNLTKGKFDKTKIEAVFHQGACTDTTEWNGRYMLKNNYDYSKVLLNYCQHWQIPFIYASSAAIYGTSEASTELPINERPLNIYGYSKLLFDQYVRRILGMAKSQIVGFRYFNVYGPNEQHKKNMASMIFHLNNQLKNGGVLNLFEGSEGYADGEQLRDFIYVEDVVDVAVWSWQKRIANGIYNLGTGTAKTFNTIAENIIKYYGRGKIKYIPFPDHLKGRYQNFTEADLTNLRKAGCDKEFLKLEDGIARYLDILHHPRP